mgnify:FL=1
MSRLSDALAVVVGLVLWGMATVAMAVPRIAVVDFDAHQYAGDLPGAQLADYVVDELVGLQVFEVIEREKLASIQNELNFGASGFVDVKSAAKLRRLLGATHLMTGRVISVEREDSSFDGYGVRGTNVAWSISVSVRIFEVESGRIVYSDRARARWVARNTHGYASSTTTPYDRLAEETAIAVVGGIRQSPFGRTLGSGAIDQSDAGRVSVSISSEPPGADIEVDGVFIGNTNGEFDLDSGVRIVRISRGNAKPWEKRVDVRPGLRINAVLAE